MQSAGEQGVILVALGTVTELGEARPPLPHMLVLMAPISIRCGTVAEQAACMCPPLATPLAFRSLWTFTVHRVLLRALLALLVQGITVTTFCEL